LTLWESPLPSSSSRGRNGPPPFPPHHSTSRSPSFFFSQKLKSSLHGKTSATSSSSFPPFLSRSEKYREVNIWTNALPSFPRASPASRSLSSLPGEGRQREYRRRPLLLPCGDYSPSLAGSPCPFFSPPTTPYKKHGQLARLACFVESDIVKWGAHYSPPFPPLFTPSRRTSPGDSYPPLHDHPTTSRPRSPPPLSFPTNEETRRRRSSPIRRSLLIRHSKVPLPFAFPPHSSLGQATQKITRIPGRLPRTLLGETAKGNPFFFFFPSSSVIGNESTAERSTTPPQLRIKQRPPSHLPSSPLSPSSVASGNVRATYPEKAVFVPLPPLGWGSKKITQACQVLFDHCPCGQWIVMAIR